MALAGVVDRISALPDDLLHLILGFVCDAKSVVRTAALSRRWRRVWIYATKLALFDTRARPAAASRFVGSVDRVLAQRGDAAIESLSIGMSRSSSLAYTSQKKVNAWLRYAMQHVVKSFRLDLPDPGPSSWPPRRAKGPAVVLPDRGKMTSISMWLPSCYCFRLPVAASAKYEALTELTLCGASFFGEECSSPGSGRSLGEFVSSCCPCLRKLDIGFLKGLDQLAIRSEALETFKLMSAGGLRVLDVTAPNLRVLDLKYCFGHGIVDDEEDVTVTKATIASSRLQEIGMRYYYSLCPRPDLEIHDLTSVCRLDLKLSMHGQYYVRATDAGFWLLEKCPSVEHVGVWLGHEPSPSSATGGGDILVDLTVEGAALFASVRT